MTTTTRRRAGEFEAGHKPEQDFNGFDGFDGGLDGSGRYFGRLIIGPVFRLEPREVLDPQDLKDV
ncbi:MAG: hypothetical protein OXF79_16830 [Chloroflexi bacterium]|nr:hypothetical protein [Chloroflexota bacterium]